MKEVKYIPGDLVEFCGRIQRIENIDKQTSYRVSIQLEHGWFVNKPEEILNFLKPIKLTPQILKANGWKEEPSENVTWYKYGTGKAFLYICKDSFNNKDWLVCVGLDKHYIANVNHVHQLQHLLFGLGLNSELKV